MATQDRDTDVPKAVIAAILCLNMALTATGLSFVWGIPGLLVGLLLGVMFPLGVAVAATLRLGAVVPAVFTVTVAAAAVGVMSWNAMQTRPYPFDATGGVVDVAIAFLPVLITGLLSVLLIALRTCGGTLTISGSFGSTSFTLTSQRQ